MSTIEIEIPACADIMFICSILHILTIVFPDTLNVKYLPIFHGSYSLV